MKKLSLIIALALCITITGVYASWTYVKDNDVADITGASRMITMTDVVFSGAPGEYSVDYSSLTMKVDPKPGTDHITSLVVEGNITVTFTPSKHAPNAVVDNAIPTTVTFDKGNDVAWSYGGEEILTINKDADANVVNLVWAKQPNGTFTATIDAATIQNIILLNEYDLDTKTKYDEYASVLDDNSIAFIISDGITTTTP